MNRYVLGLDFGSLSGRALLVDAGTGETVAESVYEYPHAVMYRALPDGTPLPDGSAVQHPQDYLDALSITVQRVKELSGCNADEIIGIAVDFTSATMLPVDRDLTPLCFDPKFSSQPKAYVTMWKDHTAAPQAELFDRICNETGAPYLAFCGGKCSAENGLAKVLCILQTAPEVYHAAYRILEAGDWITMLLTGEDRMSYNFAAYKQFWVRSLGGYPSKEFLRALDPRFESVVEDKFGGDTVTLNSRIGVLTESYASLLGLKAGTPVAPALIDSNAGIPACGVYGENVLTMIVGTSLCHLVQGTEFHAENGFLGITPDGLYEGLTSYEAGQSSCGDHMEWFLNNCLPASYTEEAKARGLGVHALMREKLSATRPGESGLLCLDWFNGNRSIYNDPDLSAMIVGMTLQTKPEEIYRALLEGTAFGTRRIYDNMIASGVAIDAIVACGGIALKDPLLMQIFADVLNRPIRVCASKQAPALGSAIRAAVAAGSCGGGYDTMKDAVTAMARLSDRVYEPNPACNAIYESLYQQYLKLHDAFGQENGVMKRLRELRGEVVNHG